MGESSFMWGTLNGYDFPSLLIFLENLTSAKEGSDRFPLET